MDNLFDILYDADKENMTVLLENERIRIERIVSCGQTSPASFFYDQNEDEWVSILDGEGHIEYTDGMKRILKKGDNLLIPAHTRHRVSFTSKDKPCIWLCVFYK